jgi:hypothetical protein
MNHSRRRPQLKIGADRWGPLRPPSSLPSTLHPRLRSTSSSAASIPLLAFSTARQHLRPGGTPAIVPNRRRAHRCPRLRPPQSLSSPHSSDGLNLLCRACLGRRGQPHHLRHRVHRDDCGRARRLHRCAHHGRRPELVLYAATLPTSTRISPGLITSCLLLPTSTFLCLLH